MFIQCVGSREPERPYCSRVCCTHSVDSAIRLKELDPEMNVTILYRDMRTYGLREEHYTRARELGVMFIKFYPGTKPRVFKDGDDLKVQIVDPILAITVRLTPDYLVLAAGIVPNPNQDLVELFKASVNADGFFNEAHPKLRPVDIHGGRAVPGGPVRPAQAPGQGHMPGQGRGVPGRGHPGQRSDAAGCGQVPGHREVRRLRALCLDVCPYKALSLEEYRDNGRTHRRIVSDKALCKGCGLCEATCPKEGVTVLHFTMDQLKAEVDTVLESLN